MIEVQPSPQYKPLNYKFQETEKNAFVIANLPKYKKEDVQANVVDNNVSLALFRLL
jgi:HSP20 family molecular chaperone IbpA